MKIFQILTKSTICFKANEKVMPSVKLQVAVYEENLKLGKKKKSHYCNQECLSLFCL
jgi:hypothetical protein